jgi:hypothetical protein
MAPLAVVIEVVVEVIVEVSREKSLKDIYPGYVLGNV